MKCSEIHQSICKANLQKKGGEKRCKVIDCWGDKEGEKMFQIPLYSDEEKANE